MPFGALPFGGGVARATRSTHHSRMLPAFCCVSDIFLWLLAAGAELFACNDLRIFLLSSNAWLKLLVVYL